MANSREGLSFLSCRCIKSNDSRFKAFAATMVANDGKKRDEHYSIIVPSKEIISAGDIDENGALYHVLTQLEIEKGTLSSEDSVVQVPTEVILDLAYEMAINKDRLERELSKYHPGMREHQRRHYDAQLKRQS